MMPTDCFLHTLKWQCALCLPLHGLFFALEACDCVERIDDKDQLLILQSPILYHIRGLQPSALYSCHHIYFGPRVCFRVGQWHRYPMDRNNSVRPIDAIMSAPCGHLLGCTFWYVQSSYAHFRRLGISKCNLNQRRSGRNHSLAPTDWPQTQPAKGYFCQK